MDQIGGEFILSKEKHKDRHDNAVSKGIMKNMYILLKYKVGVVVFS